MRSVVMTAGMTLIVLGVTAIVIGIIGHWDRFMLNGRSHEAIITAAVGIAMLGVGAALVGTVQRAEHALSA